ncbi:PH domain-containing protein [Aquisalibacillus elongatus]|uniref:YdbS-like PH domain-containing protein n=1 Tax=Aquisalibacillus elongatus TaxID=485577 RepID=A0A3N5B6U7_9BACI|nr:PH domain-containing protein [Aquisalibacillus elongatus]RPF53416.1 hypothetical protein EDC24_1915 [Aquisalibacillus elongatus]
MRQPPKQRIAEDAIKAWRLSALLYLLIPVALTIGAFILTYVIEFLPPWVWILLLALTIIDLVVSPFILPKLRWRRWRYEVLDDEIYIQHGILIVTQTLIPMIRVQHVDTKQGPILANYKLATLTISTAATIHEIPALTEQEASNMRDLISELARVEQEDV